MGKKAIHTGLDELLKEVQDLSTTELNEFVHEVLTIRAARIAPVLKAHESQLMEQINSSLSEAQQLELNQLIIKRQEEKLTKEELAHLIQLTEEAERLNTLRMEGLSELAQIRQKPLRELMQELKILPS